MLSCVIFVRYLPNIWLDNILVLQRLCLIWRIEQQQETRQKDFIFLWQVSWWVVRVKWGNISRVDDCVYQVTKLLWKWFRLIPLLLLWLSFSLLTLNREHCQLEPLRHRFVSRLELYPEIVALSTEYHRVLGRAAAREHCAGFSLVRPRPCHNC